MDNPFLMYQILNELLYLEKNKQFMGKFCILIFKILLSKGIFTNLFIKERHAHAMECYFVTSRRCGALLQWITQVSFNSQV